MPNFDRTLSNRLDQSFLTVDLTVAHRSTASHFLTFWLFGVKLPCEFGVSCDTIYFHYSSVIIERSVVQKESYPHQVMSWIEWHMWWIITIAFQFGRPCDASFIYHWFVKAYHRQFSKCREAKCRYAVLIDKRDGWIVV